jgi:hypothetical protein
VDRPLPRRALVSGISVKPPGIRDLLFGRIAGGEVPSDRQELGTAHAVPVFQVMPRFYFDFDDDGGTFIDKDGEEFADVDAATRKAMAALGDAARDFCRSSPGGRLAISVRSEEGPIVELSATLRLNH